MSEIEHDIYQRYFNITLYPRTVEILNKFCKNNDVTFSIAINYLLCFHCFDISGFNLEILKKEGTKTWTNS